MNPHPDTDAPPLSHIGQESNAQNTPPWNWLDALVILLSSRISLIRLESRDVARSAVRRALIALAAVVCAFFTWALLLAAGIAAVARATCWHWYWIALIAAALHLLGALLLAHRARKPGPPAFPVTQAEFLKDREWIHKLQRTRKSGN